MKSRFAAPDKLKSVPIAEFEGLGLFGSARNALRQEAVIITVLVMNERERFLFDHQELTRRYLIRLGASAAATLGLGPLAAGAAPAAPELTKALGWLFPMHFHPAVEPAKINHSPGLQSQRGVGGNVG